MRVVSFLHQKGGTGKSTLAIAAALALAQTGRRVLLLDADPQGTASEWGNRFAIGLRLESHAQVQPVVHQDVEALRAGGAFDWIVIDGPPSLSPMTESILRASDTVIVPVRPAKPDVWAIPWLAAIVRKLQQGGQVLRVRVVFNQHAGEPLEPLREELAPWRLPVHGQALPLDPAFAAVFDGQPLPGPLAERLLDVIAAADGAGLD
jgi:chromosome partitioning protein